MQNILFDLNYTVIPRHTGIQDLAKSPKIVHSHTHIHTHTPPHTHTPCTRTGMERFPEKRSILQLYNNVSFTYFTIKFTCFHSQHLDHFQLSVRLTFTRWRHGNCTSMMSWDPQRCGHYWWKCQKR